VQISIFLVWKIKSRIFFVTKDHRKVKLRLQNGVRGGDIIAVNIDHLDTGFGVLPVGPGQGSAAKPTALWASCSSSTGPT